VGAAFLLGAAAGSAAYAAVVSLLARWPSIVRAKGSGGAARPVLVAAVAVPLAVVGVALLLGARADRTRRGAAVALVGVGAAWVAWGLVEQHLLRTFVLTPNAAGADAWDALFHGVGLLTAGVGTSLLSAGGNAGRAT